MPNTDSNKLADIAKLLADYEKEPSKIDDFFEIKFILSSEYREKRQVCQFIFLTLFRNKLAIEFILKRLVPKKMRPILEAILKCAAAELIASDKNKHPKIVHAWVDAAKFALSRHEARLVNAVSRRFIAEYADLKENAKTLSDFALLYSHPEWLAKEWAQNFGEEKAIEIMRLNQRPSEVFFRLSPSAEAKAAFVPFAEFFEETNFEGFYKMKSGSWQNVAPLLDTPYVYIQDPATSFAPAALAPKAGETILDLCAAPGGKSRILADLLLKTGDNLENTQLVSVDIQGPRFEKLQANLAKINFLNTKTLACDMLKESLAEKLADSNLPTKFDAILIDAPCSNTGVLRRRPDARYRIKKSDIKNCAEIQSELIKIALPLLKPKGRLVYSTCSIENEENISAPTKALESFPDFKIQSSQTILPIDSDGAGISLIS